MILVEANATARRCIVCCPVWQLHEGGVCLWSWKVARIPECLVLCARKMRTGRCLVLCAWSSVQGVMSQVDAGGQGIVTDSGS